ncbi:protein THEM6 [Teleopsis dalmanni]|uniref:protein THEM6 n=1 Tax=Teleopsis dalmanni TaxID=139649 RepID=UPI0018CFE5C3|nr:protein THEM6 [Teleopsis dalmanni]
MSFWIILLILFIGWDVNYFLHCGLTVLLGKLCRTKRKITDTRVTYGFCSTQDVDVVMRHMNNARYLRELDFARFSFYAINDMFKTFSKFGGVPVQGATNIRYRRAISIFNLYKVHTKLIWWDEKALYLEHKFVTFDGFVRAIAISKQSIANSNVIDMMKTFPETAVRPEIPEDLKLWLDANEISSQNMRKEK